MLKQGLCSSSGRLKVEMAFPVKAATAKKGGGGRGRKGRSSAAAAAALGPDEDEEDAIIVDDDDNVDHVRPTLHHDLCRPLTFMLLCLPATPYVSGGRVLSCPKPISSSVYDDTR